MPTWSTPRPLHPVCPSRIGHFDSCSGELASTSTDEPKTVRYVGTSSGLAGLVADIEAASVADAVLIIPVVSSRRQAVCNRISAEVVPLLRRMA